MVTYKLRVRAGMYPTRRLEEIDDLKEVLYTKGRLVVDIISPIMPQSYIMAQAIVDMRHQLGEATQVIQDGVDCVDKMFRPRNILFQWWDKIKYRNVGSTSYQPVRPLVAMEIAIDMRGRLILTSVKTELKNLQDAKEHHWKVRTMNSTAIPSNLKTFLANKEVIYIANEKGNLRRWKIAFEERSINYVNKD